MTVKIPGSRSKGFWLICLLTIPKILSSFSYFLLHDFLSLSSARADAPLEYNIHTTPTGIFGRWSPSFQILAFIQLSSGLIYTVLLRSPAAGKAKQPYPALTKSLFCRVIVYSFATIVLSLLPWITGLQLCGAYRTIIAASHYNFTIAGIISSFVLFKSGPKLRGSFLFGLGWVILLLYDDMNTTTLTTPPQHLDHDEQTLFSRNSVGLLLLMTWLFFRYGLAAVSKNLSTDVGGSKRLHALTCLYSGIILFVLLLVDIIANADLIPIGSNILAILFITIFGFILEYQVDIICAKRFEASRISRIGTTASLFSALLIGLLRTSNEMPTTVSFLAFILIYLGVISLTSQEKASGGGSFVGYSSEGLPLFNFSNQHSDSTTSTERSWRRSIFNCLIVLKRIFEDSSSRKLFYLFAFNLIFCVIEFMFGYSGNSLALFADGFRTLFDSCTLLVGIIHCSVICQWKPTSTTPFGFSRIEVLAKFVNSALMLTVSICIVWQAIPRLLFYQVVDATTMLFIVVPGVFLKIVIHTCSKNSRPDHRQYIVKNSYGKSSYRVFLEDTFGRLAIVFSSLIMQAWPGISFLDSLCALTTVILLCTNAIPLMKETGQMLLLAVPDGLERGIQQALLQILSMEGVKGYKNHRFWTHSPEVFTGSMHIQITHDTNEQKIIRQVNGIFCSLGFTHFTIQLEKDEYLARKNSEILSEHETGYEELDSEKIKNDNISSSSFQCEDTHEDEKTHSQLSPLEL